MVTIKSKKEIKLMEEVCKIVALTYQELEKNIEELVHTYYSLIPYIPQKNLPYFREYCDLIQEDNLDEIHDKASKLLNEKIVPCIKKELHRHRPLRH